MIRLEKCGIDDEKLASLGGVLKHTKRDLVKLFLDSNEITDAGTVTDTCVAAGCGRGVSPGAATVAKAIAECPRLSRVHIRRNKLTSAGSETILAAQAIHPTLQAADVKIK
jgi:hypothetical protein